MEKYLIYQLKDSTLKKKPIANLPEAEAFVAKASGKTIKLQGQEINIVGIGTDEDFRVHQQITNQTVGDHYKKLKANAAHYKKYGVWPKDSV